MHHQNLNLNNLDDYSLEIIFKFLDILNIKSCSSVCIRWYTMINRIFDQECMLVNFGNYKSEKSNYRKIKSSFNQSIKNYQKLPTQPIIIENNHLFRLSNLILFKKMKTFIFNGNNRFTPYNSFSIEFLSNLEYIHINDENFSEFLCNKFRQNKFTFPLLKFMIIDLIRPADMIYNFPNLIFLELKNLILNFSLRFKKTKIKYFKLSSDYLDENFVQFLLGSLSELEHLDIKYDLKNQSVFNLIHLLQNLIKLKDINLKLNCDDSYKLIHLLTNKSISHKKLIINNLIISNNITDYLDEIDQQINNHNSNIDQNNRSNRIDHQLWNNQLKQLSKLYPIYSNELEFQNLNYIKKDKRENFDKLKYFSQIDTIKIHNNDDIILFKSNYKLIGNFKNLIIHEFYNKLNENKFKINLNPLLNDNVLPGTLKRFRLFLSFKIDQNILNQLPIQLKNLEKFEFIDQVDNNYDLNFLSKFYYLNSIEFHFVNILNTQQLIDAIQRCKFLSRIFLVTASPKKASFFKCELLNHLILKKNSIDYMKFDFILNGTQFI